MDWIMLCRVLYARDSSEGSSPSQMMLQHSLDQSFRNLMQICVPCFYLNHEMLLNIFIHSRYSLHILLKGV